MAYTLTQSKLDAQGIAKALNDRPRRSGADAATAYEIGGDWYIVVVTPDGQYRGYSRPCAERLLGGESPADVETVTTLAPAVHYFMKTGRVLSDRAGVLLLNRDQIDALHIARQYP